MQVGLRNQTVAALVALSFFANGIPAHANFLEFAHDCHTLMEQTGEAIDALDAMPFARRVMDGALSRSWSKNFDFEMYEKFHAEYRAVEKLDLETWEFNESKLAYLVALIERATNRDITLGEVFLDDPRHARKLQLLCRRLDFSKKLTRHQLKEIIDDAFLLTGKLDLKLSDFKNMNSKRLNEVMVEYAWKEIAKVGVLELYESMGLLKKKPSLGQKLAEIWHNPIVSTSLLIPTWLTAPVKLRPGYLPKIQWVRFKPETIEAMLKNGIEPVIESKNIDGRIKQFMRVQETYDYVRSVVAIWAGLFFVAYTAGNFAGKSDEELQKWVLDQGRHAMDALRSEFTRTGGKLAD